MHCGRPRATKASCLFDDALKAVALLAVACGPARVTLHVSGQRREIEARLGSQRRRRLQCDCCATVRRDFIVRWTYSTQSGLVSEQPVRCEAELGYVVLCKVLSGAGYRLRPTSKIGEFTRDSSLLSKVGISLAEACRAGTRNGWRTGSRGPSNGYIISAARKARRIPGRIRKTSGRTDCPERAPVAPTRQMNSSDREGHRPKPNNLLKASAYREIGTGNA